MIERDVKNKVKRIIAKYEHMGHVFWSYWPVQTGFGKHGIPDCLICLRGYLIAIETKVDCKTPTARQWQEIFGIDRAYGVVVVVDQHNLHEVNEIFDAVLRGDHLAARLIAKSEQHYHAPV